MFIGLGLNIIHRQNLPMNGPVIVAANHNSHLDTLVLLALFPISMVHKVRPVAAADYFLSNPVVAWLSLNVIGIIPLCRSPSNSDRKNMFEECHKALSNGDILIIFPEGSRGQPEVMSDLKKGIYHIINGYNVEGRTPPCPVIPVVMRGLGLALPKGTAMFVPFNCDVVFGEPQLEFTDTNDFVQTMQQEYDKLLELCIVQTDKEIS